MTISDPLAALREMRRVLKPGGALLEHGLSPEPTVERWHHRLTPLRRHISSGRHFDRRKRVIFKSLDLIHQSLSDSAIDLTASIIN